MTDKRISPLRRRMSEDMTVRGFTAGTQARIPRGGRKFHGLSWPLAGTGGCRGSAALSVAHEILRGLGDQHERGGLGLAFLLRRDPGTGRGAGRDDDGARAAQAAGDPKP